MLKEESEARSQNGISRMKSTISVILIFLTTLLLSCKEQEETPITITGPEYFPLATGSFIVYKVDSIKIIQNIEAPYSFQLRVSVKSSFTNDEGNKTFLVQREKRADETQPWKAAGTWTAWSSVRQAVLTEGTTSYIKLQFPLNNGIGWNGNALNNLGGDDLCDGTTCDRYDVTEVDPLVVVTLGNDEDVLKKDFRVESYSKDIGLVYKESIVYRYCDTGACFGTDFIIDGIRYKQEMIDHGTL